MILKILLIFLIITIVCALTALLAPMYLVFKTKDNASQRSMLLFFIIHPSIFKISYTLSNKKTRISLFNLLLYPFRKKRTSRDDEVTDDDLPLEDEADAVSPDEKCDTSDFSEEEKEPEIQEPESIRSAPEEEPAPEYTPPLPEKIEEIKDQRRDEEKPDGTDVKEEPVEKETEETRKTGFFTQFEKWKKMYRFVIGQKKIARKGIKWTLRFFKRVLKVIRFDYFAVNIKAGFEDPTYAGILYGIFTGIYHSLDIEDNRLARMNFEPSFENEFSFKFDGAVGIRTSLFRIFIPVIEAILLFPYVSAFILWRRTKKFKVLLK